MTEKRLVSTWEAVTKDEEGEAHVHTLHKYDYDDERGSFTPATPARVTPSRAKTKPRNHNVYVALGDAQIDYRRTEDELIPLHDERAMYAARLLVKSLQPDMIVNLGDHVDLTALSKFKPDSDHFHRTLGPSFQRAHDYYAELRADNPNARIVEVDSNHNTRLKDFMLRYMPQMYGVRRAGSSDEYPVMTYPYLANLQHLDVEWVSGYGSAELVVNDDLSFRHGTEHSSPTSPAAAKALKNRPDINTIQGHDHRESRAFRTTRTGEYIGAIVVGTLAKTTGEVPGFHSAVDDLGAVVRNQQNWQQGLLIIRDYGDQYQYESVPIQDGKLYYQGEEYGSE